jgi:hypothetical protein
MPTQSTVPAVLTALVTLWQPVVPTGMTVYLGPIPGGDIPADYVTVAWADDALPSVQGRGLASELGNSPQVSAEEYGVWCAVSASGGDELAAVRMARVDSIFQALVAAVRANRTLSGAILPPGMADLGDLQWQIEAGGSIVTIYFQVSVVAPLVV